MLSQFTRDQFTAERDTSRESQIASSSRVRPLFQFRLVLGTGDLGTARTESNPLVLDQPFDGFYVESATDSNTSVNLSLMSPETGQIRNYVAIKQGDTAQYSQISNRAILTWSAQAGNTITIVFFMGVQFKSGSLRSLLTGGVTNTVGSGCTPSTQVSVATTATLILAASSTTKMANVRNKSSYQYLYISGTNAVTTDSGTKPGIKLGPGESYDWDCQSDIYGIYDTATENVALNVFS